MGSGARCANAYHNSESRVMAEQTPHNRRRDLMDLVLGVAIVLLVLFIGSFLTLRLDLTSEKRYTLTPATKQLVQELDEAVFLKVYLDGDLPADLERLSRATQELLDEMRIQANDKLEYSFIDPNASPDDKTRREVYASLEEQGLTYTSIRVRDAGSFSERIVFPGALMSYKGKTIPVQLLKTQFRAPDADIVNRSINNLEFEISSAIRQITAPKRARIAFVEGHGELDDMQVMDVVKSLQEHYDVKRVQLDEQINSLSDKLEGGAYRTNKFDALVIAKPDTAYSDKDLFIVDQFIMNGGKVLWLLDKVNANLDSLRTQQFSMAVPLTLGIEDILFSYGVRINNDLLQPAQTGAFPLLLRAGAGATERSSDRTQHRPGTYPLREQLGYHRHGQHPEDDPALHLRIHTPAPHAGTRGPRRGGTGPEPREEQHPSPTRGRAAGRKLPFGLRGPPLDQTRGPEGHGVPRKRPSIGSVGGE